MIVNVTQRHIDRARELLIDKLNRAQSCCPIALALKDCGVPRPLVGDNYVEIDGDDLVLPDEARHFVERFDDDQPVAPFSFEMVGL